MNPQNKTKQFNLEASVSYKRKTVEEHMEHISPMKYIPARLTFNSVSVDQIAK